MSNNAQGGAKMNYSFPMLNNAEILSCLQELNIPFSEETLTKPNYESVKPMYEEIVSLFMNLSREEMAQPVFAALEGIEYPELHDDAIPVVTFVRALAKLMAASGIPDFSLKDLYKPDYQRTRRNLSAIINFGKYREEKLALFTELSEQAESSVSRRAALVASNAALKQQLARLQADKAAEAPEAAVLEHEIDALVTQLRSLQTEVTRLNDEGRVLKQRYNETSDKAAARKVEVMNKRNEMQELRDQIVSSPEKVQRALREIEENVDREKSATALIEKRTRDLTTRLDVLSKMDKELSKTYALLEEVDDAIQKKKEVSRKVKELHAKMESDESAVLHAAAEGQHLRRQRETIIDRIQRIEQQTDLKKEAALSSVQQHLAEKAAMEAENQAALLKLRENEGMTKQLHDKLQMLMTQHEGKMSTMMSKYNELRSKVKVYHENLLGAMKMPAPVAPMQL